MEGLQPGANDDAAAFCDQFEAVHRLADEVSGLIPGMGNFVHTKEMRGINHRAQDVAVAGHLHNILSGMGKIDGALPCHDPKDVEREQDTGGMELGISLLEEGGDHLRALRAARGGLGGKRARALLHFRNWAGVALLAARPRNWNQAG